MNNLWSDIKNNWAIVGFITFLILWYGATNGNIKANAQQIEKNTTTIENIVPDIQTINHNIWIICNTLDVKCIEK